MIQYLYPQNLKATANIWFWSLKDFVILGVAALLSIVMMVFSAVPDIEINCTDSSECFYDNKSYLQSRLDEESNQKVRKVIKKDVDFLDNIQMEMATARQFLFIVRVKNQKD